MIDPNYTKNLMSTLAKIEQAERKGDSRVAIAYTRQLLSYFYMYIRELEIRELEKGKTP